jgi:outer membrane protein OmpA-like peptidoglycan-associated protein
MSPYVMFETPEPMAFGDFHGLPCRVTSANMALFWGYSIVYLTLWKGFWYTGDLIVRSLRMSGTGLATLPSGAVGHGWTILYRGSGDPLGEVNVPLVLVPEEDDYVPEPALVSIKLDAREERPVTLPGDVLFAFDSAEISLEGIKALTYLADLLNNRGRRPVRIVGHTDGIGRAEYNVMLSRRRAAAVKAWLVRHGVDGASDFRVDGRGEREPLLPERRPDGSDDPVARARNRRVMVHAAWSVKR